MKKFLTIALALALAVAIAAPAMATDVSFLGTYRIRGSWAESLDLDDRSANDTFMSHRFRLQTKFAVNDMLSVTTRFDALDGTMWGETVAGGDFDWDRTWMTIKTADYGVFDLGRMVGGLWGTTFVDNEIDADRIKWGYTGIENFTFLYIYQANIERDGGTYGAGIAPITFATGNQSDQDNNTHHLAFVYKQENWAGGLLYAFTNNKTRAGTSTQLHSFLPYFNGVWGPFALLGELRYNTGENDADDSLGAVGGVDTDISSWAANLQGTYNFGPAKIMFGGAWTTGEDRDATQTTGFGGFGTDWDYPVYIMAGNDEPWDSNLGGATANLSGANYGGGSLMWYGGVSFAPVETVTLGMNLAIATADETENIVNATTGVRGQVDDDQGTELDLILDWNIHANLTYHAVLGWFWSGDYWRDAGGIDDANFDDAKAFFNELQLKF